MLSNIESIIYRIFTNAGMQVETVQTNELSQIDKLINEIIEQRKVIDIKLTTTVFQEKILYTALVMLDD